MEGLQQALDYANQQRDAAEAARIAAETTAAQALLDLAIANAAAVAFALSPALASSTLINYKTGEGIKIYGKATSPRQPLHWTVYSTETQEPYDCS